MASLDRSLDTQGFEALRLKLIDKGSPSWSPLRPYPSPNKAAPPSAISHGALQSTLPPVQPMATVERRQMASNECLDTCAGGPHRGHRHGHFEDTQPMQTQIYQVYSDLFSSVNKVKDFGEETQESSESRMHGTKLRGDGAHERMDEHRPMGILEDDEVSLPGDDGGKQGELERFKVQDGSGISRPPQTPAVAGRKRKASGEIMTSVPRTAMSRTPGSGLASMFGSRIAAADLSLTQVFEGTQAISSPAPDAIRSDPVFDRPSPLLQRRRSSPGLRGMTSPAGQIHSDPPPPVVTGPLDQYRSLRESQESRSRRQQHVLFQTHEKDDNAWTEDSLLAEARETALRYDKLRGMRDALSVCAQVTAPAPSKRLKGMRNGVLSNGGEESVDTHTPARSVSRRKNASVFDISDDLDDEGDISDPETCVPGSILQVPMTSSRPFDNLQDSRRPFSSPSAMPRPKTATHPVSRLAIPQESPDESPEEQVTQRSIAIADSQGDSNQRISEQPVPPASPGSQSIASSQQQTHGPIPGQFEDQMVITVDTSSIPPPPVLLESSTSRGEIIPSSPPLNKQNPCHSQGQVPPRSPSEPLDAVDLVTVPTANEPDAHEREHFSLTAPTGAVLQFAVPAGAVWKRSSASITEQQRDQIDSVSTGDFQTARTQFPAQDPIDASANCEMAVPEANDKSRPRRLTEIANEDPPPASYGSIDVADINIMDKEDEMYVAITKMQQSPVKSGEISGSSPVRTSRSRRLQRANRAIAPTKSARAAPRTSSPSTVDVMRTEALPGADAPSEPISHSDRAESIRALEPSKDHGVDDAKKHTSMTERRRTSSGSSYTEVPNPTFSVRCNTQTPTSDAVSLQAPNRDRFSESPDYPNRVLALFRGRVRYYYPATCLGPSKANPNLYRVQYDDGSQGKEDASHICRLVLRVGDEVRVDHKGMRNKAYIIKGLKDQIAPNEPNSRSNQLSLDPQTDIFGHLTAQVIAKTGQRSDKIGSEDLVDIPITYIIVTTTMWPSYTDRWYSKVSHALRCPGPLPSPLSTEAVRFITPANRGRRHGTAVMTPMMTAGSDLPPRLNYGQTFAGMAFAITMTGSKGKDKADCVHTIVSNGGRILEDGFEELFGGENDQDANEEPPSPPQGTEPIDSSLVLCAWAAKLGFVALISDSHNRRAKFVQALALNIPCLHYQWVVDSIAANAALEFPRYLLPAGESKYLNNAIRSRTLVPYNPISSEALLSNVISRRPTLLQGGDILLITGKGKGEDRWKTWHFLTLALGAQCVRRVKSCTDARALMGKRKWDFIYVEGDQGQAAKELFGSTSAGSRNAHSKRKRGSRGAMAQEESVEGLPRPRIVNSEFVVQSLILGALL